MRTPSIISSICLCIALLSNASAQSAIVSPAGGKLVVAGAVSTISCETNLVAGMLTLSLCDGGHDNWSMWDGRAQHVPTGGATDIRTKNQRSVSQGGLCGGSTGETAGKKGNIPQSSMSNTDSCLSLFSAGLSYYQNDLWQMCYDTLTKFVNQCPNYSISYRAFDMMTTAVSDLGVADPSIYLAFQNWLKSVLYLNTSNSEYFCQCVEAISGTFYSFADTTGAEVSKGTNTPLSVIRWLLLNTNCDRQSLVDEYNASRYLQRQNWLDDTNAYPLDTTLPSMADLGLDTLLARHLLAVVPNQPISIILNATASPNPVSTGTIITFGLSQEAYVKINLFDILGETVSGNRGPGSGGEGFEGLFQPGNHEVPLSLQGLPSGTYYARILTAFGSVATVKLVKEQ